MSKFSENLILFGLFFLLFLNGFLWQAIFYWQDNLQVSFFDVGQGDAIFIDTPQHHQILIDGGPNSRILQKLARVMPFWDRTIDLVILTHPEKDHLEGLLYVLKHYRVKNILWTGVKKDTALYKRWLRAIKREKARIFVARASLEIKAGYTSIDILYPFHSIAGKPFRDSNDTSIVSRLVFAQTSFLFMGDATKKTEYELLSLENGLPLKSNILKVGHHGSKTSSSEIFLKKVMPSLAVISVGKKNPYGHPSPEVLQRLNNFGIKILRTDESGDISVISNGRWLKVITQRSHSI